MEELQHRELNKDEQQDLLNLYYYICDNDYIMKKMLVNKKWALLFPYIIIFLTILMITTCKNIMLSIFAIILGLLSIQLNFIFSHMYVHALMLVYSLWNETMINIVGNIPPVVVTAFYHHHNEGDWAKGILSYTTPDGAFYVMVSHWVSFSLFTSYFPINGILLKLFILINLVLYPAETSGFFLGYEFGAMLLPISHAWVHNKIKVSNEKILYYSLKFLEYIGIFATKEDHKEHHNYSGEYVYTSFTSSGLYSVILDNYVTNIWNYSFKKCKEYNYQLYKVLMPLGIMIMYFTLGLSIFMLIQIGTIL